MIDELDELLQKERRRDRLLILLTALACLGGMMWGVTKVASVHYSITQQSDR